MAPPIPRGAATHKVTKVMRRVPQIKGTLPKNKHSPESVTVGFHTRPKKNSKGLTWVKNPTVSHTRIPRRVRLIPSKLKQRVKRKARSTRV
jgi:hypothetical protein